MIRPTVLFVLADRKKGAGCRCDERTPDPDSLHGKLGAMGRECG
jgi:hypothetical protein